jgi:hypothetical protein
MASKEICKILIELLASISASSYVVCICAGDPGSPRRDQRNGKLQTWLKGPGFGPLMVLDKNNMGWRHFNNVSIDTLYFSVFFGGSSDSFRAKKDEV